MKNLFLTLLLLSSNVFAVDFSEYKSKAILAFLKDERIQEVYNQTRFHPGIFYAKGEVGAAIQNIIREYRENTPLKIRYELTYLVSQVLQDGGYNETPFLVSATVEVVHDFEGNETILVRDVKTSFAK